MIKGLITHVDMSRQQLDTIIAEVCSLLYLYSFNISLSLSLSFLLVFEGARFEFYPTILFGGVETEREGTPATPQTLFEYLLVV